MGKKTRPGTGGRRTILQLSPPCLRSGTIGGREEALGSASDDDQEGSCDGHTLLREGTTNMRNPAVKTGEGLSLLGAYEDSDDEDTDSQPTIGRSQHNQSGDIDSTLANFMAEIDAITTQPGSEEPLEEPQVPAPTPPRPEPKANQQDTDRAAEQRSTGAQFQYDTQCSLAGVGVEMGDWQEVWDENTGCYYYWNTLTNEVVWQLPHYLADQVQSLQQYADSATVNGNGASQTAGYYPEQNSTTSATTLASKKETKKKEVMESVVALTSEEEERRGVAASLLAPLIPSEVKEAEEKWRKRLLGGLEEKENSLDSEGEGGPLPGSPAVPLRDPDSQREQRSRNQSKDNSEAEEEPDEDTMELELALERKKAELRALEEGDGSAGGSSPCSETSQEASGSRSLLQKKARWKTSFIHAASPDSNSRESDTQDNSETAHPKAPEKTGEENEDVSSPDRAEEKTVAKAPPKEEVETPELKFQIGELANTLTNKMEFLGINRKAISNFQLLLLQTEMRIADWREGALNGIYLRRRLQEAAEHIKHYELNAAPKGWSCHWDREHRRYFYVNDRTSASQWDFPDEEDEEEGEEGVKGSQIPQTGAASQGEPKPPADAPSDAVAGSSPYAPVAPPPPTFWSSPQPPLPPNNPPPPSDYPPPPPPPPESPPPPPPPPDSDDGEIMEVEMEDEEGEPPAPGTEEDGSLRTPFALGSASTRTLETSLSLGKGQKRKASAAGQQSKAVIGSSAILYTQTAITAAPVMSGSPYWSVPVVAAPSLPAEAPAPPLPPPPTQPPLPPCQPPSEPPGAKMLPTDKTKKLKKDKSKKSKTKMPPLVKKWQSIQRELDEEEKNSSSDEDRDQLNKRSIEEWKQQQLTTGKAGKNANFEALPDDWRERLLKKRKMMKSK